ncbi:MAG: cell division protein ZapA [Clostridia bacterium]|nr:cell division protein ZapA [Clostridia bacterium]MBQ9995707.1 cell division protein ZapA [Clostridia bacterium]
METNKKKYNLEIAGMPLSIVTDEPSSFVESIVNRLDERITEMTQSNYRISTLDACLLCAIDYLGDKMKAEKRIRNLEAQISLYEDTIQRLNDELDEAKAQLETKSSEETAEEEMPVEVANDMKKISDILRGGKTGSSSEDKVRTLEKYLESKKTEDHEESQTREEKIKYIESLLRGNDSGK